MEYCSLENAYGPPNQEARRQERKKAKRCKGPALSFLEPSGADLPDADRQSFVKQAPLPAMNPSTGLREHVPLDADVGTLEEFQDNNTDQAKEKQQTQSTSFFGKDPAENFASFSHVIGDAKEYRLQPDFSDAFRQVGTLDGAGATALPTPSVKDVWKPLTPTGARSAFFDLLPPPGGEMPSNNTVVESKSLHSKLDKIFARLDELEATRTGDSANAQTEVLLFIMSGIFVLFLTDLAVRKGAR
jgi:hypothetical protein